MSEQFEQEEEIRERRRQRIAEMQRNKERQLRRRKYLKKLLPVMGSAVLVVIMITVIIGKMTGNRDHAEQEIAQKIVQDEEPGSSSDSEQDKESDREQDIEQGGEQNKDQDREQDTEQNIGTNAEQTSIPVSAASQQEKQTVIPSAKATDSTILLGDEIISSYALLIDLDKDEIVAQKLAKQRINPASMTKVLTVLVAAEHVTDLQDTFTMTIDITDYSYVNDCSSVGFQVDEVITVEDLFYGTILPSGGDAAVGLATYVAGSQENFVKLMNDKLEELGLSETAHVTNCVGLYDEDHYCTVYDMAMIMEAAIDNELCRKVLSEHTYTTSKTGQHPEGIEISNWFLRKIEDKDTGGVIMCGKTGYVVQSGNCAVSYGVADSGKEFICVTADATSGWRCIYDHVALYKQFAES